jgi:hypothetical protein
VASVPTSARAHSRCVGHCVCASHDRESTQIDLQIYLYLIRRFDECQCQSPPIHGWLQPCVNGRVPCGISWRSTKDASTDGNIWHPRTYVSMCTVTGCSGAVFEAAWLKSGTRSGSRNVHN